MGNGTYECLNGRQIQGVWENNRLVRQTNWLNCKFWFTWWIFM
jgi:hypothetical protein